MAFKIPKYCPTCNATLITFSDENGKRFRCKCQYTIKIDKWEYPHFLFYNAETYSSVKVVNSQASVILSLIEGQIRKISTLIFIDKYSQPSINFNFVPDIDLSSQLSIDNIINLLLTFN